VTSGPGFLVIPAVDIKGGKCVRLWRGLAEEETVYDEDPVKAAVRWQEEGAELLHVVDLDGAFSGVPVNDEAVASIARRLDIPIEVGGGIRTTEAVRRYIAAGVDRIVVGTAAFKDPEWLRETAAELGERLVAGVDVKEGKVAVHGWMGQVAEPPPVAVKRLESMGVERIIYTNVMRDGTLEGPDVEGLRAIVRETGLPVIASGGISSIADILEVAAMVGEGVEGVITGVALYKGRFTLAEAISAVRERRP
jgi:phosphoribosylformimino-5-aminoimidazole carboxamide ribotide isomerase